MLHISVSQQLEVMQKGDSNQPKTLLVRQLAWLRIKATTLEQHKQIDKLIDNTFAINDPRALHLIILHVLLLRRALAASVSIDDALASPASTSLPSHDSRRKPLEKNYVNRAKRIRSSIYIGVCGQLMMLLGKKP